MSGHDDVPATNGTAWRLHTLEARVAKIESHEPAVLAERISSHIAELADMREELKSLRRALYTFSLSIAGGAIVFGVGVLQVIQ